MTERLDRSTMRIRTLGVLAPLVLAACPDPFFASDCPAQVQIVVSGGTTPQIDWTPRCHVYTVIVSAPGDLNQWSVHGPPQYVICGDDGGPCPLARNALYPPLRYGVVPDDAFQDIPLGAEQPPPLVAGYPYTFRLYVANRRTGSLVGIDTVTITP